MFGDVSSADWSLKPQVTCTEPQPRQRMSFPTAVPVPRRKLLALEKRLALSSTMR